MIEFVLGIVGLAFGSFVNALVWRIRHKRDFVSERSECTHCHHVLAWNDLIPVVSWAMLRGKCRYCHKKIDDSPIVESITAMLFILSYVAWPFGFTDAGVVLFIAWLTALVILVALAVYDIRWYLLPDKLVFPLVGIGVVIAVTRFYFVEGLSIGAAALEMGLGVLMISGLYFVLHQLSSGKWVGFGDVKLAIFIGLVLGWQSALLALFLANLVGLIVVLPLLVIKKIHAKSKIPFGPFLIVASIIAFLWGEKIISWYLGTILLI
jgi:prepilin signal peptidase PulO-like enzyme (type II secretory pathway)